MICLIGIGNYTCGDDGIGPRLVEAVCDRRLDTGFTALELPGHGIDLLTHFTPETDAVLIVDCAQMGLEPGAFKLFEPDQATSRKQVSGLSTHENDILELIAFGEAAGCPVPYIRILAIQPETTQLGDELSVALAGQFETYIETICREMKQLALGRTP